MAAVIDFPPVTFGRRVTKPCRTLFGVLALFENASHQGQFFLRDGTPIGPLHASLEGAMAYGTKKGWRAEPEDADEIEDDATQPYRGPLPTRPDAPAPKESKPAPGAPVPSRVRPKPPRRKKRGK